MSLGRSIVEPLRRRPPVADAVIGLALGTAFVAIPILAGARLRHSEGMDLEITGADITLTVVSALALTQMRRHPLAVLIVTSAATLVSMAGGWQVNLAQLSVTFAMFGYALNRPRKQALTVAAVTSVLLGAASILLAGLWRGEWGRQDVVLWLWTATAIAIAGQSKRAAMTALEDRARRAEESREETARRRVAEDRVRIARELHDVIAHHVAVISVQSGVAEHLVERDPEAARSALHHVRAAARSVLTELQSVLGVLRQDETALPTAPTPGLVGLDGLVASFRAMGATVEVQVPAPLPVMSPAAEITAFRLVQEALTNVQKHASGASAAVRLQTQGAVAVIEVANARPPHPLATPHGAAPGPHDTPTGSGLGLVGMRERVLAAGGSLETGPTTDGGFRVAARLPLAQEDR